MKKKSENIELGYGIEKPVLKGSDKILEDAKADEILKDIDQSIAEGEHAYALAVTENLLNSGVAGYYRQEALFRLGMIYFEMGGERLTTIMSLPAVSLMIL